MQFDLFEDGVRRGKSQRWYKHQMAWQTDGAFDPARHEVVLVGRHTSKDFVERHHYSRSFVASQMCVALMEHQPGVLPSRIVGTAAFSNPCNYAAIRSRYPHPDPEVRLGLELGRFVLLEHVKANAETWFLQRALAALHAELPHLEVILSYSDPCPRETLDGETVTPGHIGRIYQGMCPQMYVGRGRKRWIYLTPDGRVLSERSISKIRTGEKGAAAAADTLVSMGAPRRQMGESDRAWVTRVLAEGPFRRRWHVGNHAYMFPLGQVARRRRRILKTLCKHMGLEGTGLPSPRRSTNC